MESIPLGLAELLLLYGDDDYADINTDRERLAPGYWRMEQMRPFPEGRSSFWKNNLESGGSMPTTVTGCPFNVWIAHQTGLRRNDAATGASLRIIDFAETCLALRGRKSAKLRLRGQHGKKIRRSPARAVHALARRLR